MPLDHLDRRTGQERGERRLDDPGDLAGTGDERRPPVGDGDDRRDVEVADRDPEPVEQADDPHAGRVRVEPDLLGRLAQRRRDDVGVLGLGLPPGKLTSPRVVAVARRPLGEHDPRLAVVVGVEQDEHGRRPGGRPPARAARRSGAPRPSSSTGIRTSAGGGQRRPATASRRSATCSKRITSPSRR